MFGIRLAEFWFVVMASSMLLGQSNLVASRTGQFGLDIFRMPAEYQSGRTAATRVAVGDFDRDGKLDLEVVKASDDSNRQVGLYASCTVYAGVVGILLGKGDGAFQAPVIYPDGANTYEPSTDIYMSVTVADANGDGHLDLLILNGDGNLIQQASTTTAGQTGGLTLPACC